MITITQIQYLLAVAQTGHFGRAAGLCLVSQPSLSFQVQKAEESLGFLIFDRTKKPIQPTEKGDRFLEKARVVLTEYQDLLSDQDLDPTPAGQIHLGTIPTIGCYLLPEFLSVFTSQFPKVTLVIHEGKTHQLIEQLQSNTIDAAILATSHDDDPRLIQVPLFSDPFWIYTSTPARFPNPVTVDSIQQSPMWLLEDGHCFRDQILDVCGRGSQIAPLPGVQFVGGSLETLVNMIARNGGTTVMPDMAKPMTRTDAGGVFVPFQTPAPYRKIAMTYRRRTAKLTIIDAICKTISRLKDGA